MKKQSEYTDRDNLFLSLEKRFIEEGLHPIWKCAHYEIFERNVKCNTKTTDDSISDLIDQFFLWSGTLSRSFWQTANILTENNNGCDALRLILEQATVPDKYKEFFALSAFNRSPATKLLVAQRVLSK